MNGKCIIKVSHTSDTNPFAVNNRLTSRFPNVEIMLPIYKIKDSDMCK